MPTTHEQLAAIIDQVKEGMPIREGITQAVACGYLALGTAVAMNRYVPTVLLNAQRPDSIEPGTTWRPRIPDGQGGSQELVRATRNPDIALWTGLAGDLNSPQQRLRVGRSLTPGIRYPYGSAGWRFQDRPDDPPIRWSVHENIAEKLTRISDDTVIANVDFALDDKSFTVDVPGEPGNVASPLTHTAVGTMPVRVSDLRPQLTGPRLHLITYPPLIIG